MNEDRPRSRAPWVWIPTLYLAEQAEYIPRINYPERWWSKGNLAQLVCLRKLLLESAEKSPSYDLLRMGALAMLRRPRCATMRSASLARNPATVSASTWRICVSSSLMGSLPHDRRSG